MRIANEITLGRHESALKIASTRLVIGVIVMSVAVYALNRHDTRIFWVAPALTILLALLRRRSSAISWVVVANYPYALGAYIGAKFEIVFYPWSSIDVYESVALEQVSSLLVAYALVLASGLGDLLQSSISQALASLKELFGENIKNQWIPIGISLVMGVHDLFFALLNFRALSSGPRHSFQDIFWVASSPFSITISLAISLCLMLMIFAGSKTKVVAIFALLLMWAPSLLAGSRNYLSILGVICLTISLFSLKRVVTKILTVLLVVLFLWIFIELPSNWSTNQLVGYNEWILPTSSYIPLYLGNFSIETIGATPMLNQWPLLLPSPLRPYEVSPYGDIFASLKFTNVGVAGNPWAEVYNDSLSIRILSFALVFSSVIALSLLIRRMQPFSCLFAIGLLAFWGRSVFWNSIFIVIYSSIALSIIMILIGLYPFLFRVKPQGNA